MRVGENRYFKCLNKYSLPFNIFENFINLTPNIFITCVKEEILIFSGKTSRRNNFFSLEILK